MRILAIADEEESWLADRFRPHSLDDVDLIVSCGDLPARYLSNLVDLSNKPLAFVPQKRPSSLNGLLGRQR